jgi:hypothetical protein
MLSLPTTLHGIIIQKMAVQIFFHTYLHFKQLGSYLNFSAWFMENKIDFAACHKNAVNILVARIYKMNSYGVFAFMCLHM